MEFNSVEHAYIAAKTNDINIREQIQTINNPHEVKKLGKTIALRSDWNTVKLEIMRDLIKQKFNRRFNMHLCLLLMDTKDEHIQEGNWWCDYFWGVSIRNDKTNGRGDNNLGKLIMERRKELIEEEKNIMNETLNPNREENTTHE
jgi:hypothetical protein